MTNKKRAFAVLTGSYNVAVTAMSYAKAAKKAMRFIAKRDGNVDENKLGQLVQVVGEGDTEDDEIWWDVNTCLKDAGLQRIESNE